MSGLRIVVVIGALVLCAASATSPKKRPINTTTTMSSTYEDTWRALVEVFTSHGWQLVTADKVQGVLATDWMKLENESHTDCGAAALGKDRDAKVRVVVRVKTEASTTTIAVDAAFQKTRMFDDSARVIDCASRGTLESEMFSDVSSQLKIAAIKKTKEAEEAARAPFYCTSPPNDANRTVCARDEARCASLQAELEKAAGGATPCEKREAASCFIGLGTDGVSVERCYPTALLCIAERTKLTTPPAQMKEAGECSQ